MNKRMQRLGAVLLFTGVFTASAANAAWDSYQGDAAHTGYVGGTFNAAGVQQIWSKTLPTGSLTNMAVDAGQVFVSSSGYFNNSRFYAINAADGNINWQTSYSGPTSPNGVFSTNAPAYANGIVYLQTCNNGGATYLHAYNASTGAALFHAPFSAQWENYLNPAVYGGHVYIDGGTYGGMYSFNATTGGQDWFGYVGQYDGWTPAVDANYTYCFTGSGDTVPITGEFRMFNRLAGTLKAFISLPNYPLGSYTMNSAVTLGSQSDAIAVMPGGQLYPTGTVGGRLISFDVRADATHTPHIGWMITDGFSGQASVANGAIFTIDNGHLSVRSETDGHELWSYLGGPTLSGPLIVTDNAVLASGAAGTYAIDLATHLPVWSTTATGHLALSDGVLYIADSAGNVSAFNIVPEPASVVSGLFLIGSATLHRRRRRGLSGQ